MSEQIQINPEHKLGEVDVSAEIKRNLDRLNEQAADQPESAAKNVEVLRQEIEQQAISGREVTIGEHQPSQSPVMLQKDLKDISYKRTLQRIQNRLPIVERTFSKVIHRPVIEKSSELLGKTVARPSGVLVGGLVALLGSSALLYMSRNYGFEYNYFMFLLLFVGGFLSGIILEMLYRVVRRNKATD